MTRDHFRTLAASWLVAAVAWSGGASRAEPGPAAIGTRVDPAVALAFAEAAARLPEPAGAPDGPQPDPAFAETLAADRGRCTPLAAVAALVVRAACGASARCTPG